MPDGTSACLPSIGAHSFVASGRRPSLASRRSGASPLQPKSSA